MAGSDPDRTHASFPPYAELTRTQAWGEPPERIATDSEGALEALEVSPASRYTEGTLLGQGGMGKVLLARDARLGREVALKVLHGELTPDDRARFLREAQVQGQLEHPSIVPVYDIDRRPDGSMFFTMRRVLGRTLESILDELRRGVASSVARYTQRELLTAFATVCLTIDYAHTRGVVHRDLKPANIMLGDFGEVYVLDWGLARLLDERAASLGDGSPPQRISLPGSFLGTPMYMAPEQWETSDVGPSADIYALGLILFEILTLLRARDPEALYATVEARPSVRASQRHVAPELEAICVKATADDPDARFASARALHEDLVAYLEGDRDLERRRALAAEYAAQAQQALAKADEPGHDSERQHTEAMQRLRAALALDPTNADNVRLLATMLTTPPKQLPPEVAAEVKAQEAELVHAGARYSISASLSWFAFLPFLWFTTLREPWMAVLVLVPTGVAALLAAIAVRRGASYLLQLSIIGATVIGAAATTTMFGPLVLTPTLLATFAIVVQAHPNGFVRALTWLIVTVAIVSIMVVELVHPHAVIASGAGLRLVPQMHDMPRAPSIVVVMLASVAMTSIPCLFISRVRRSLNVLQRQNLLQAWQFRRFGEDLIRGSKA